MPDTLRHAICRTIKPGVRKSAAARLFTGASSALILLSVVIAVASTVPTLTDALRQHMMRAEYVLGGFFLVEYSGGPRR